MLRKIPEFFQEKRMSITHRCIPLDSPNEWTAALEGIRHTFGCTWEHCYAMHLTTGLKTFLYCFEKDDVRIVSPITEREFKGYVDVVKPFGFSGFVGNGNCPEFAQYWKEFAQGRGYVCGYLGLNPAFDCDGYFDSSEIYQYDNVYVLDLTPPVDEILAKMARKRRQQFNKWDDIVSNFVLDKPVVTEFFLKYYHDFLRGKNASSIYFFSEKTLRYLFDLSNVTLIGVRESGKLVSAVLFAYTGDMGDALYQVSLPEGQCHSAALLWFGAIHLKSLGVPAINFGGGGGGVADFKRRFGGSELPLRCIKQIYRQDVYESLCRQANVDYKDITGYFPAYRRGQAG
jgi:hypothetical protein